MRFIGRTIKYLLRSVFSIIIFLLLVGLAKTNRDIDAYVMSLNTTDWAELHWAQPDTWVAPFWTNDYVSGDISDMFSDDVIDTGVSGLDVYDPTFEEDLNAIVDSSGAEEDFGFIPDEKTVSNEQGPSGILPTDELLNVIKQSVNK